MGYRITRRKQSTGHMGGVRLLAECEEQAIGYIPRQAEVSSPYAYSPVHTVYRHPRYGSVVVSEASHRRHVMYSVSGRIYEEEEPATQAMLVHLNAVANEQEAGR